MRTYGNGTNSAWISLCLRSIRPKGISQQSRRQKGYQFASQLCLLGVGTADAWAEWPWEQGWRPCMGPTAWLPVTNTDRAPSITECPLCLQQRLGSYLASTDSIGTVPLWREQQFVLLESTSVPNVGLPFVSGHSERLIYQQVSHPTLPPIKRFSFWQMRYDGGYTTMESTRLTMYCFPQK